jgi:3-oxoacyl-[acyl-carrier protein] reductase
MRIKDKVSLITGAAQGIGRSTAELFAQEGAQVVLVDLDGALAEQSAQEIAKTWKTQTLALKADVTRLEDCEAAIKATLDKFGKIDILVNNAGITKDNLILRMSEAEWDAVLSVNLKGAFNFTKAACRSMLKSRSGRIINIASVIGQEGNVGQANYAASKGGLIALTKTCAREFASRNILVNAVAPGFIRTRLTETLPEDVKTKTLERILLNRMGQPEEVARVVLFLACEDSSYLTGQVIGVNGGMHL